MIPEYHHQPLKAVSGQFFLDQASTRGRFYAGDFMADYDAFFFMAAELWIYEVPGKSGRPEQQAGYITKTMMI